MVTVAARGVERVGPLAQQQPDAVGLVEARAASAQQRRVVAVDATQVDPVVGGVALLAQYDDLVGGMQPTFDRGLQEAVADHPVAGEDDPRPGHDVTATSTRPTSTGRAGADRTRRDLAGGLDHEPERGAGPGLDEVLEELGQVRAGQGRAVDPENRDLLHDQQHDDRRGHAGQRATSLMTPSRHTRHATRPSTAASGTVNAARPRTAGRWVTSRALWRRGRAWSAPPGVSVTDRR